MVQEVDRFDNDLALGIVGAGVIPGGGTEIALDFQIHLTDRLRRGSDPLRVVVGLLERFELGQRIFEPQAFDGRGLGEFLKVVQGRGVFLELVLGRPGANLLEQPGKLDVGIVVAQRGLSVRDRGLDRGLGDGLQFVAVAVLGPRLGQAAGRDFLEIERLVHRAEGPRRSEGIQRRVGQRRRVLRPQHQRYPQRRHGQRRLELRTGRAVVGRRQ